MGVGETTLPEVSRFFGIIVGMFFNDHEPPHFHVRYAGLRALIAIEDLRVIGGHLPPRALGLAVEWAAGHRAELMENWRRARGNEPLVKIEPLE